MPVKITSRYTPLTYDEITKPLIQATEAQMALEDAYAQVGDNALAALSKVDPQADPETYNRLKAYAEDLQTQADSLAKYGLQRSSRQALLNLRRRYGQEVTPVDEAIARRKALADEQRKLRASNPYLRFERDMSTTNLGSFIDNPELDYGRTIDLNDISKRAATITKALGQGRTDVRNGKQIDKYTKEVLTREGFTPEEIQAALSNDANADSALKTVLDNLYASTGASSFGADTDAEVRDALDYGAYLGAGEVKSQIMADQVAKRRDELADRAHNEDFQRELYGIRYGNNNASSASVNPSTGQSYKDGELTKVGDHWENSDGDMFTRVRKDVYAPYVKEEKLSDAQKNALSSWKVKNGGYLAGFDEDDDYSEPHSKFIDIVSRYISDAGNLTDRVKIIPASSDLQELNTKEREKVEAAIAETKLPSDHFTVIKVTRGGLVDDDVFVVYNNALDSLLAEASNKKSAKGYVIPDLNDENEGLQGGDTSQNSSPETLSQLYFNSIGASTMR